MKKTFDIWKRRTIDNHIKDISANLVAQNKIRIELNGITNFRIIKIANQYENLVLNKAELNKPNLHKYLRKKISNCYLNQYCEQELTILVNKIAQDQLAIQDYDYEFYRQLELEIAQLIIQATPPEILHLLFEESIEFFISFDESLKYLTNLLKLKIRSNVVGFFKTNGSKYCIYIAAGNVSSKIYNDWSQAHQLISLPVIIQDRIMVILAHEIGHYIDVIKSKHGIQLYNFSGNYNANQANYSFRNKILYDLKNIQLVQNFLNKNGLKKLMDLEYLLISNKILNRQNLIVIKTKFILSRYYFLTRLLFYSPKLAKEWRNDKYLASNLNKMIIDIKVSLYIYYKFTASLTKTQQDAVKNVEVFANLPQLMLKWGKVNIFSMLPTLSRFYKNILIYYQIRNTSYQLLK